MTNYSKKRFRHMTLVLPVILSISRVLKYCWWKKSCTTWNVFETLSNNGINYQPQLVSLPDFFHQEHEGRFCGGISHPPQQMSCLDPTYWGFVCVGVPCGFHRGLVRSRGRPGGAVAGWSPVTFERKESLLHKFKLWLQDGMKPLPCVCVIYSLDTVCI